MQIIRNREIVEDGFTHLADEDPLPASEDVTVSLARWKVERSAMAERDSNVGVRLAPGDDPVGLKDDLTQLQVIVIEFPNFKDGRGYSAARLLRDRLGYTGELRATGDVLRDQLFYMERVGINAFEMRPGKSLEDALQGFADFSVTYQAAADEARPIYRRNVR